MKIIPNLEALEDRMTPSAYVWSPINGNNWDAVGPSNWVNATNGIRGTPDPYSSADSCRFSSGNADCIIPRNLSTGCSLLTSENWTGRLIVNGTLTVTAAHWRSGLIMSNAGESGWLRVANGEFNYYTTALNYSSNINDALGQLSVFVYSGGSFRCTQNMNDIDATFNVGFDSGGNTSYGTLLFDVNCYSNMIWAHGKPINVSANGTVNFEQSISIYTPQETVIHNAGVVNFNVYNAPLIQFGIENTNTVNINSSVTLERKETNTSTILQSGQNSSTNFNGNSTFRTVNGQLLGLINIQGGSLTDADNTYQYIYSNIIVSNGSFKMGSLSNSYSMMYVMGNMTVLDSTMYMDIDASSLSLCDRIVANSLTVDASDTLIVSTWNTPVQGNHRHSLIGYTLNGSFGSIIQGGSYTQWGVVYNDYTAMALEAMIP
jgi:hypothetical protein